MFKKLKKPTATSGIKKKKNIDPNSLQANVKDLKDLIAPAGIDATYTNHLEIIAARSRFARTMITSTLPRTATFPYFLRNMYTFGDSNTSVFINPIPGSVSQTDLNKEINEILSEIYVARNRGDINRERVLSIKKAEKEQLRDEIASGYNQVFTGAILNTIFSASKEELDDLTEMFKSEMSKTLISTKSAWSMQDTGFQSNMPFNDNKINEYHNFDRGSMGTVFPFFASEVGHKSGIPLCFNARTNIPIFFDNFSKELTNYNMVIFGVSGSGKSVTTKVLASRSAILQDIKSLALDVEGEYRIVAESLGGINVVISPESSTIINIFDIESENEIDEITKKERPVVNVAAKVEDVTQSLLIMAKGSTKSKEVNEITKQIISETVMEEYEALGINENVYSLYENTNGDVDASDEFLGKTKKKMPTIGSWYKRLEAKSQKDPNPDYRFHYSYLLKVMRQYVREFKGQLAYFDGQSTYDLNDDIPFINLDISSLEENFARPLAQQILLSWVWEKYVKKNSEDKTKASKKRVIIDEAWMLLQFEEAVQFLDKMARRARKRNVSLAVVSQRARDFHDNPKAQAVITSAATKILLKQDSTEIDSVKEIFKLTEGEARQLIETPPGTGLLKLENQSAIVSVRPTRKEFEFVETNVNEQVMQRQARALKQKNPNKNKM